MRETVVAVTVVRPYVLDIAFADGAQRQVDMEPLLWGEVFEPLRDPGFFALVTLDPILKTVVWPNGADLAPECLYYGEETPYGRVEIQRPVSPMTKS
ncbi:MAG TPA: DUF2442 domain-containing protein [Thermomicrobiales bacterium]|nr:DUF2442 domain-containing protein [Thermomicrobiales bacterium]